MTELRIVDPHVVESLQNKFVAPTTSLPEKYRILFSLRNIAGKEAHDAMLMGRLLCSMHCTVRCSCVTELFSCRVHD